MEEYFMAETYPSENSLLNLMSDSETGVAYIETGTAPYYLEFRKLIYRLLLASRRANDLRVFDEGDLEAGVKAGSHYSGGTLRSYGGSSGNTMTDEATNYVYVDSSGVLQISTAGYPAVTTNHVRLARVMCSNGDIASITDDRGPHVMTAFGFPVGEGALTSATAGGITTGAIACKRIASAQLKALLDEAAKNLFAVNAGDVVLKIVLCVKTTAGMACTVDIGFDAAADGATTDADGWLVDANANAAGQYSTENDVYDGVYALEGGRTAAADGNVTITSSANISGSSFVGGAYMIYIPA
jgi:hypothetical protein